MNIKALQAILAKALHPEDVFGTDLKGAFRQMAALCHPDKNKSKIAEELFKRLNDWKELADKKVEAKTYGDRKAVTEIAITVKGSKYVISKQQPSGALHNHYLGNDAKGAAVIIRVTRTPANNAFTKNEATKLKWLRKDAPKTDLDVMRHIPVLQDTFELEQGKTKHQVNVFPYDAGWVTLEQVHAAYPVLDLASAAWMFNRLLGALLALHSNDLVHGAVLPCNFMVHPETHGGVLTDYCYCVESGKVIKAILPRWELFYPKDVVEKKPANFGMDLFMAAQVMRYLTGVVLPRNIHGLLNACTNLGYAKRTQSVVELYRDFDAALKAVFGRRKFKPFAMPADAKNPTDPS